MLRKNKNDILIFTWENQIHIKHIHSLLIGQPIRQGIVRLL
jgi:hypothetical protein